MENKENRKLEKVAGEVITPEWIENEIDKLIDRYCIETGIDDLKAGSQNEFYGCMMYIYKRLFKNTDILKDKDTSIYTGCTNSNYNMYNYNVVDMVLDYYIYIGNVYNKITNIVGFCYLTGIHRDTINDWNRVGRGATSASSDLAKKLIAAAEDSAAGRVASGVGNPVGLIAYLNHYHGWSQDKSNNTTVVKVLTSSELPRLGSDSDKE